MEMPTNKPTSDEARERLRASRVRSYHKHKESKKADRRRYYRQNRDRIRAKQLEYSRQFSRLAKYGVTQEAYDLQFAAQGEACATCARPGGRKGLAVDHCHTTGRVRGLLCGPCNTALGSLREDPATIRALASYIESGGVWDLPEHTSATTQLKLLD